MYFEVILVASTCWWWFCVWNVAMVAGNSFDESELDVVIDEMLKNGCCDNMVTLHLWYEIVIYWIKSSWATLVSQKKVRNVVLDES